MSKSGIKGRPRGRPFAKGQSGNPGGRPVKPKTIELRKLEHDVRMFARDWGFEAIDKLVALMRGVITVEIDKEARRDCRSADGAARRRERLARSWLRQASSGRRDERQGWRTHPDRGAVGLRHYRRSS